MHYYCVHRNRETRSDIGHPPNNAICFSPFYGRNTEPLTSGATEMFCNTVIMLNNSGVATGSTCPRRKTNVSKENAENKYINREKRIEREREMGEGWELKTIGPLPHLSLNHIHCNLACHLSSETGAPSPSWYYISLQYYNTLYPYRITMLKKTLSMPYYNV